MKIRAAALAVATLLGVLVLTAQPAQAAGFVPGQYIAKVHTEAHGKMPSQYDWNGAVGYFQANGCSVATLKAWGKSKFAHADFVNLYGGDSSDTYNEEKVLTAYRSVLNRDPDSWGFGVWVNRLDGSYTLNQLLDSLYASQEFYDLATTSLCVSASNFWNGNQAPIDIGATPIDGATLQSMLNNAPAGGTVALSPRTVVRVSWRFGFPRGQRGSTVASRSQLGRPA